MELLGFHLNKNNNNCHKKVFPCSSIRFLKLRKQGEMAERGDLYPMGLEAKMIILITCTLTERAKIIKQY